MARLLSRRVLPALSITVMLTMGVGSNAAMAQETRNPTEVFDLLRTCVDQAAAPRDVIPACSELFEAMPFSAVQEAGMYANRGEAFFALEDYSAAAEDFKTASSLDPGVASHPIRRATSLRLAGDLDAAMSVIDHALAGNTDRAAAHTERGTISFAMGQGERALEDFAKAEMTGEDLAMTFRMKGIVLESLERFQEAEEAFTHAIFLARNDPHALLLRGHFYLSQERYALALQDGYRAERLGDRSAKTLRLRGIGYMMTGESHKALSDLLEAYTNADDGWQETLRRQFDIAGIALPPGEDHGVLKTAFTEAVSRQQPGLFPPTE